MSNVELFFSHDHNDRVLVGWFSETLKKCLKVPSGKMCLTSVPKEGLNPGDKLLDTLLDDIKAAQVVIAVVTPNSIHSNWCLLELGAAWGTNKTIIPVSAGIREDDLPLLLKQLALSNLASADAIELVINTLQDKLKWSRKTQDFREFIEPLTQKVAELYPPNIVMPFKEKRKRIGETQCRIIDFIERFRDPIEDKKLKKEFNDVKTDLYYRLETLRLLGFLTRETSGHRGKIPVYRWTLSTSYRESRKSLMSIPGKDGTKKI